MKRFDHTPKVFDLINTLRYKYTYILQLNLTRLTIF